MGRGIALAIVATLALSGLARAQAPDEPSVAEQEARSAFEEGRMAFERGDCETALARFERAFGLSGRPELLFNIGIAYERLQEDEQAIGGSCECLENDCQTPACMSAGLCS